MFTGIIQAIGTLTQIDSRGGDCRLCIATGKLPMDDVRLGDSIAVNGVCLTAVGLGPQAFCGSTEHRLINDMGLSRARQLFLADRGPSYKTVTTVTTGGQMNTGRRKLVKSL